MRRTGYTGLTRTASGKLRRTEPFSPNIPTLKRSFEVEEDRDATAHPSLHTRRATSLRATFSPTGHLGARNSDPASGPGPAAPACAHGPGGRPARRPGVPALGDLHRHLVAAGGRRAAGRRLLPLRPEAPGPRREAPSRRLETLLSNNCVAPPTATATANHTEQKAQPPPPTPVSEVITAAANRSDVIPSYNSAMSEPVKPAVPAACPEVPSVDFSYVGIDAILEQMRRKAMKQGFELNIMVVGQSGLGKSTLMNTLFKSKVSRRSVLTTTEERIPKTIEIKSISHDIEEKGVRMKLTVIDTPGFGDQINNENCWQPIMKFINDQYEQYLQEEININRKKRIPDSRVHCCIYFIPPTGHCLRPLDVEFMRRLSKVVNIVPVIAKADTLTLEERDFFKMKIREELRVNGIDVYPQKEFDEDAEDRMINEKIREMIPFAVVGSDQEYQVNGRRILGRKTKWGTIEVENIGHCEFAYLRDLLIRTHMQNIKDITSSIHYEVYRVRRLNESNAQTNGVLEHHASAHEM
ncbi:hypothetical protein ANANG_G00297100 [Anguilla anguilla]|uniref:Septin-type G domain-containing protein n=1 Tax=Anguilla anguilla TaxID=7936 RepID=A0A9D3LUP0_ANGAN|nr:hypothetical protein ANANG_G00297100 [Anguilla anguilla]